MQLFIVMPLFANYCGSVSNRPVTLVVWSNNASSLNTPGPQGDYARYIVSQFEKEHPNVTVKLEDHGWDEQFCQNLTTSLLGGTAPDVVVGESFFRQFAAMEALVPLDNIIDDIKE